MGKTTRSTLLPLALLVLAGCATTPAPHAAHEDAGGLTSGALFDELAEMDRRLFDASFVACDARAANAIFSDDVEFYHDKAGFSAGDQVRENTRRLTASCPANTGVTRMVVPGSLRVYPIEGYGAAQIGMHRFDEVGSKTSTLARFVHVWRRQGDTWRLTRVLSLDHTTVPASATSQPAVRLESTSGR